MGIGCSLIALFWATLGMAASSIDLPVPAGKVAKLRAYEEMRDGPLTRQVLVGRHLIPEGSEVTLKIGEPLLYRWLLNDQGKIIQSSMPYFAAKVRSLPEQHEFKPGERELILEGEFFVHIRDFDAAAIISAIFRDSLPEGIEKVNYPFAWDSFNPTGTWAHALQKALAKEENSFLTESPPRDMEDFCPRFLNLSAGEKEIFWIALFNEIARHESAFIPLTASDEGAYDPANKGVISSGLTQVSLRSSKANCYQQRGCSLVKGQNDLFDPEKNLRCAVGIMSCLSESAGCLSCKKSAKWNGIAAYWSTMRDPYEVTCTKCPSGKVTIGKKPEIRAALRNTVGFCY